MSFGEPRKVLLVPEAAVRTWVVGRGPFETSVHVINNKDVVEHHKVKRGQTIDGLVVVEKGLKPDDWVVIDTKVRTGDKVKPRHVAMPRGRP